MSVLRISLFGGVRVEHQHRPPTQKATRAVQGLLAYLLLQPHRTHAREVLLGVFWGDQSEESARGCLNTTLWRLRRVLEPDGIPQGTYLVNPGHGEVGFNWDSDYWLDVAILEERASRVLSPPGGTVEDTDISELEGALPLYGGELLEGVYSDWALRERERLRTLYLNSLVCCMRYHRDHGAYEKSLIYGQQILTLEPLREEIHRAIMRLYLASGQRTLAIRQFETCREILSAELDVEPMEETQAVYAQIVDRSRRDRRQLGMVGPEVSTLQPVLLRLREALRGVEQAREQCQRALQLTERFTEGLKRKLTDH